MFSIWSSWGQSVQNWYGSSPRDSPQHISSVSSVTNKHTPASPTPGAQTRSVCRFPQRPAPHNTDKTTAGFLITLLIAIQSGDGFRVEYFIFFSPPFCSQHSSGETTSHQVEFWTWRRNLFSKWLPVRRSL